MTKGCLQFLRIPAGAVGIVILGAIVLVALLAHWIFPGSPWTMVAEPNLPPLSPGYLFGTDMLGRDIAAGVAHGARVSLSIGFISTLVAVLLGASLGAIAGYLGGLVDELIMRMTEVFQTIPGFLLALLMVAIIGPSMQSIDYPRFWRGSRHCGRSGGDEGRHRRRTRFCRPGTSASPASLHPGADRSRAKAAAGFSAADGPCGTTAADQQPEQALCGPSQGFLAHQRIGIARAPMVRPDIIVADEPVSALDVSVQKQVLQLLRHVREQFGLAMLFITHDLRVASQVCDRIAVMHLGRIIESGTTQDIFRSPQHDHTRRLFEAMPGQSWESDRQPLAA